MNARSGLGCLLAGWMALGCAPSDEGALPSTRPPPEVPVARKRKPVHDQGDAGTTKPDAGAPDAGWVDAGSAGHDGGTVDAGVADAGTWATDAGARDAGAPDAGTIAADAGMPDAGSSGGATVTPTPALDGWQFFGVQNGGPTRVYGVTADEGGNIWVAGGEDGLFLLTPAEQAKGASAQFRKFTLADGLHPYGYLSDGTDVPGPHYLKVLSVSGGASGTVFVGYKGRSVVADDDCEANWDGSNPDPSVYKSGDADRVTLRSDGALDVVHYDIFSGPGMVAGEPQGRERICSVYRIQYVSGTNAVWFGGNHGFAVGRADFAGAQVSGCFGTSFGSYSCNGLYEHAHPAYACYPTATSTSVSTCTYRYTALSADLSGTGMWIGGWERSLHYDMGSWSTNNMGGFWTYEANQFNDSWQLDLWPDAVRDYSYPSQRTEDQVSGVAALPDGSAWFSSYQWGLVHVLADGSSTFVSSGMLDKHLTAIARDPADGSVWAAGWAGISRLQNGQFTLYGMSQFGYPLVSGYISDVQAMGSGSGRKMLIGFRTDATYTDAIGVYSGQ